MSEKPILFNGDMVNAILDGRKTQTRRVIKPQPVSQGMKSYGEAWKWKQDNGGFSGATLQQLIAPTGLLYHCPYGVPGDHLWVRETWQAQTIDGLWWHEIAKEDRSNFNWAITNLVNPAFETIPPKWLPSIHMPRWASRITLEITDVRVERVQDISGDEAIAEGIIFDEEWQIPRNVFGDLWDSINAKRGHSWESNPWVWIVEFKVTND